MAKSTPTQLTSWSISRYFDYKQCPLKAKLKHLDKIQEPPNEAMARGADIHDRAANYITGKSTKLPSELSSFKELFQRLRKQYKKAISGMVVEDTWAFTKEWLQTEWNNWTACWVRIKLDCAEHEDETTLVVRDWKTGKFRQEMNEEYVEQLELYALAALLLHEHIEKVKVYLVYVDVNLVYPTPNSFDEIIFTRADIPKLKKLWEKRVGPMLKDKRFAPRPNSKCCWCHYRSSNKANGGGQCKF